MALDRRVFLYKCSLGSLLMSVCWRLGDNHGVERALLFFVAGVRFNATSRGLAVGDELTLRRGRYRTSNCIALLTADGTRVGYVPRTLVKEVTERRILTVRVVVWDKHAVPWKRLGVATCRFS
jgi:hypothetical protein